MNKVLSLLLISIVLVSTGFSPSKEKWELIKNSNNIKIFTRKIDNSDIKEVKAIIHVDASLSTIVSVLKDVKGYKDWVYECEDSKILKEINKFEDYYYTKTDAPWPVGDRDAVVHNKISQNKKTKVITSISQSINGIKEKIPGLVRVKEIYTEWKLIPQQDGTVYIIYKMHINPGGDIPSYLMNKTLSIGPYKTLSRFKEKLKEPRHKNCVLNFIKN